MKFIQFVEILLVRLYELDQIEPGFYSLNEIADELLDRDKVPEQWVFDAGKILESRGWAKCIFTLGGECDASITGEGRIYVEEEKGTGTIKEYMGNPKIFLTGEINQIELSSRDRRVSQASDLTMRKPNFELLDKIVDRIRQTKEIQNEQKEELIESVEMVKKLLNKPEPNRSAIAALLQPLGDVASLTSLVFTLIDRINALGAVPH
jgi:hypothetical protein